MTKCIEPSRPRSLAIVALLVWPGLAPAQRVITTVVGTEQKPLETGSQATEAGFNFVRSVVVDPQGNLYATELNKSAVFKITPEGTLTVIAGNGIRGYSGDGGPATSASLDSPAGLALGPDGSIFVSEVDAHRVRKIDPDGVIHTYAGVGTAGFSGDGGPAVDAMLNGPDGLAVDSAGNLYIADRLNDRVRQVSPDGVIRPFAGNGVQGSAGNGRPATEASLHTPIRVAIGPAGSVFIADSSQIWEVTSTGLILEIPREEPNSTVLALDPDGCFYAGGGSAVRRHCRTFAERVAGGRETGFAGDGGPAVDALLQNPHGAAVGPDGSLYLADSANNRIRRITPDWIIRTVAGRSAKGVLGDGLPASSASLLEPQHIALDSSGQLYISDGQSHSIRRVGGDGIIQTFAGIGDIGFSGDEGPATEAALAFPSGLAFDSAGNLYIADATNNRVRRISPSGVIETIAGDGTRASTGNGGPAVDASLNGPRGVALDAAGNVFVAEGGGNRVRRINLDGTIDTVAGTGATGSSGDGGPAVEAMIRHAADVVVETNGSLLIAESFSDPPRGRVRRFRPGGVIEAVAGGGTELADANDPSELAMVNPRGLALDAAGNIYVTETGANRVPGGNKVRQINADGTTRTIAGVGTPDFSGDGGPGAEASLDSPIGVAVDGAGNILIVDKDNLRVRAVLAHPPRFERLAARQVDLAARSTGPIVQAPPLSVVSSPTNLAVPPLTSLPQLAFSTTVSADAESWLAVSPAAGQTPRLLRISADPTQLEPGMYEGTVTVTMPLASPSDQSIDVRLSVGAAEQPLFGVDRDELTFTYPMRASPRSETLTVTNLGGGRLEFEAHTQTDSGGDWLNAPAGARLATPRDPVTVEITADPSSLAPGTYTGRVILWSASSEAVIPVAMTISERNQAILLTQRGLGFTAVAQGGVVPPQSFGVVNLGTGPMSWSVTTCTLAELECDWLSATPDSGASDPANEAPAVTVSIDQTGLAPGEYYGLVEVHAPQAPNTPQVLAVFLEVLPEGADPGAALTNHDLTFTAVEGGTSPGSQEIEVYNVAAEAKTFRSSRSIEAGRLEILPRDGTLDPQNPTSVVIQPFLDNAPARERPYEGSLTLQFSDGRVQEIDIKLAVTESGAAGQNAFAKTQTACIPKELLPALRTLPNSFQVPAAWPVGLQVHVEDNCGNPLTAGSVSVAFGGSASDKLKLTSRNNGLWDGTWQTAAEQSSSIRLTITAESSDPVDGALLRGETRVSGRSLDRVGRPGIAGVVSAAALRAHQPLGPGSLVSVFGADFAQDGGGTAGGLPLPTRIGVTEVFVTDAEKGLRRMPLMFLSGGQVNALVPYDVALNTNLQVIAKRGRETSLPIQVNFAAAQPAVFQAGDTQGHIYRNANGQLADAANPAQSGEALVILAAGLGLVDPPVTAGDAAPEQGPLSSTVNPVTVTIGGIETTPLFAGLAPKFAGLYQVNALVPAGVELGDNVELTLSVGGQTSPPVTLAVR